MVSISIVKDKLLQAHCLQSSRWSLETTFEVLTLGGRLVFGKLPMKHHTTASFDCFGIEEMLDIHNWVILDVMWCIHYENVNPSYLNSKPSQTKVDTGYICLPTIPRYQGSWTDAPTTASVAFPTRYKHCNLQPRCFMFCSRTWTV